MKKHIFILIAFLVALSSCNSDLRRAKRFYRQAQEVAATDPDSALILIDRVLNIKVFLDDDIRMNLAFLQAEALFNHPDGERRELSNRIKADKIYTMPELERVPYFYCEKDNYHKASYAALYCGYVLRELRDDDNAIVSFKDAAKYAETAGDSLAYARAQYNVAKTLQDEYNFKESITILNEIVGFFDKYAIERSLADNMLAVAYMVLSDFDNAEKYLKMSLMYAQKADSEKAYWKAMNNYSVWYREQGMIRQAVSCLRQLDDGNDTTKMLIHYLNFGKTYVKGQQYDSAAYYFNKVESLLSLVKVKDETIASAYGAFSVFATLRNDYVSALSYRIKHESIQFQIQEKLRKDNIYHINQKYDYETLQNNMNRKIISNYRVEMTMALIIIIVLTIALVLYYRIIQKNKKEAEINAALLRVMKDNESLLKNISDIQLAKLKSMQRLEILTKDQKDKYLLANLEKEMIGDKNHWEVMTELLNVKYPGIYDTLKNTHPELNELERRVYMLSNFKLSRLDEALLLNVSTSVLDKAKGKVKKLLEQENLFDSVVSGETK